MRAQKGTARKSRMLIVNELRCEIIPFLAFLRPHLGIKSKKTMPKNNPRTLQELAECAGVSIASVSRALSGADGVSRQTRERIQKMATSAGFSPNLLARRLATGKSRRLGFIVSDLNNLVYVDYFHTLEKYLRGKGYELLISDSERDPALEAAHIETMRTSQVDGLFIFPVYEWIGGSGTELTKILKASKMPAVVLGARGLPGIDHAGTDEFHAGKIMGNHIAQLGHKRVVFMSGDGGENKTAHARQEGVQHALKGKLSIARSDRPDWMRSLIEAVHTGDCTACITASTLDLFALYRPLALAGLVAPRDLSLATFGDFHGFSRFFYPIPSLVAVDHSLVAEAAAKLLLQRLNTPALPVQEFVSKGWLQEGESLGPPPVTIGRGKRIGRRVQAGASQTPDSRFSPD